MIGSVSLMRAIYRFALCTMLWGVFCSTQALVVAAESKPDEEDFPWAVLNIASLQRVRDIAGSMFESVDRQDMSGVVDKWSVDTLKETKGIDRNRPLGIMFYLNSKGFTRPIGISYLPISNLEEALETLAYGIGTVVPIPGEANRRDIQYSEEFKLTTLYRGNYLFIVGPDGSDTDLDRNFPDPDRMSAKLSSQFDLAFSLLMKGIPAGMRLLISEAVKSQGAAGLQQRDEEPESVYRLRRANGEYWIDIFEKVFNQGQEITFGSRMDLEQRSARVDIEIIGTSDSKLAKFFQNMAGKRSYFGNLLGNPTTFAMSISWLLDEKQRKPFLIYFDAAQRDLEIRSEESEWVGLSEIVNPILKTLTATADTGHIDAFAQIEGSEEGNFVGIAGIKLAASRNLPTQFADLLEFLQDRPFNSELFENLELDVDTIDGFPVHRIVVSPPDGFRQRMFGKEASLYLYSSQQAIWFAFGGEDALEKMKKSIDSVALPPVSQPGRNRVPFQFVTHAKNWLAIANSEDPNIEFLSEQAHASFESDTDAMKIEVRPTDTGVKLRIEFEKGFIGLIGRMISSTIDYQLANQASKNLDPNQPANPNEGPGAPK